MFPRLTRLVLLGMLLVALTVSAEVPTTITIQGRLTDSNGDPVAAGNKTFEFRIYKNEVTTIQAWPSIAQDPDVVSVYTDADGYWTAVVGSVSPLPASLFSGKESWLEIEISSKGTLPEILPRVRFDTGPYAFRVGTVDDAEGGTIHGELQLGSATGTGHLSLYQIETATPVLELGNKEDEGGVMTALDENGEEVVWVGVDPASYGTSGAVKIEGQGSYGSGQLLLDGSFGESGCPYIYISGQEATSVLYSDLSGDGSVLLPSNAISAHEILNEPGVGFRADDIAYTIGSSWTSFRGRTITTPTSGYVIAIATFVISVSHTYGTSDVADFAISTDVADIPDGAAAQFNWNTNLPGGLSFIPMTISNVFQVSAGSFSAYAVGRQVNGTVSVRDSRLTLLFVPTAYGDVNDLSSAASPRDGAISSCLSQAEIDQERADAEAFDRARLERELAEARAMLENIERRIAEDHNETEY